jgi:lipopolysaccharide transport system permease protein
MAAFTLFLGRVVSSPDAAIPYPLYVFAGLLPWMFFTNAVTGASGSLVGDQNLIKKVYFPRLMVPFGTVMAATLDFLIAFVLLLVLMPIFSMTLHWKLLALPFVLIILMALAAGLGAFLGALTVAYRDFKVIVPLVLQMCMFATPAIFMQDLEHRLGARMCKFLSLNPLHGIIVNFRATTMGSDFNFLSLGISALWAAGLLLFGCLYFRRVERNFADII